MESFIETVKNNPCLWNPDDLNYKNADIKESVWGQVAEECGLPDTYEAKHTWKKLRDSFRLALKRTSAKWMYTEKMNFLIPLMTTRQPNVIKLPTASFERAMPLKRRRSESKRELSEEKYASAQMSTMRDLETRIADDDFLEFLELPEENDLDTHQHATDDSGRRSRSCSQTRSVTCDNEPLDDFFSGMCEMTKKLPPHFQRRIKRKLFDKVMECEEIYEIERATESGNSS